MGADGMEKRIIEGIIVPLLTPVTAEEKPCFSQLEGLTDYVIAGGVNAIFANGTTGEFARFTQEERARILACIVKKAGGRVPVIAGVSDCGTRMVIENIRWAEDAGADAVVTTLPYYFPMTSVKEQIDFITDVTAATPLPVFLYNIPAAVGCGISQQALDAVCGIDNLCAVKDTSGKPEVIDWLKERYGDSLKIFVGDERLNYYGLSHGADGLVPSLANPFPRILARAWEAAGRQDWAACRRHCGLVDEMNGLNRFSDSWMSPNIWRKEALAQMGIMDSTFTRPYNPVGREEKRTIAGYQLRYREEYGD